MENVIRRHVALMVLAAALLLQVIGLAFQIKVKRADGDSTRLLRLWTISALTPLERGVTGIGGFFSNTWNNYIWLRGVRDENERLKDELARVQLEQVYWAENATRAQRLQALLKFQQSYIASTVAAQVVGGSGSELSRVVYIDKGSNDGLANDMPVITPTGVVGKIIRVFPRSAQVLQINDQSSGIGAILEKSRLQGILKGTPNGETQLHYIMPDEKIEVGERVLTSGGDRIFPKGLPIGTVTEVGKGSDIFLKIRVKPAAALNQVEEVLVVTKVDTRDVPMVEETPRRAADILAERLPTVQPPKVADPNAPAGATPATGGTAAPGTTPANKPPAPGTAAPKPQGTPAAKPPVSGAAQRPATPAPSKPVATPPAGATQSQTPPPPPE